MNYKKAIAVTLLSTNFLGIIGMTTTHAAEQTEGVIKVQKADQSEKINIPDTNLKAALNEALGQESKADITKNMLESLTTLDIKDKNISSIEGLEYCINLTTLDIGAKVAQDHEDGPNANTIMDLSPLAELAKKSTKLKLLHAGSLQITDFSPLKDFSLTYGILKTFLGNQCVKKMVEPAKDGSYTLNNPCKNTDGSIMQPTKLDGGKYDKGTNTITWDKDTLLKHHSAGTGGQKVIPLCPEFFEKADGHGTPNVLFTILVDVSPAGYKAGKAVESLFKNENPEGWSLAESVTQTKIDDAKTKVDTLTDTDEFDYQGQIVHKKEISRWWMKANLMVEKKKETVSLFKGNDVTADKLADGVTQEKITKTKKDIEDNIPAETSKADTGTRAELLAYVNRAQQLFDAANQKPANHSDNVNVEYATTVTPSSEPTWYGVVPSAITFNDQTKEVAANVQLSKDPAKYDAYDGSKTVDVTVKSVNGFKLKDGSKADVAYQMKKDGATAALNANNTEQSLGSLSKGATEIQSKATVTGTAKDSGKYTDTLMYNFSEK